LIGNCPSSRKRLSARFVTPHERYAGQDTALLAKRMDVYEAAKAKHPQRWSGPTRNWQPVQVVLLNPDQRVDGKKEEHQQFKEAA
jgi:putative transposase